MQSQDYIRFDWDFIWTRRVVSSITISSQNLSAYLNTDANPSTPYTPLYPWSPTTKQYVDQHDTVVSATAPSNPTEWMVWYDSTNDVLKTYDWTNWSEAWTKMVVLEYWVSTWQDFLDAYNKNALVYCKVSSWSSGYRMAFMAYTAWTTTPTEVEFQYYRSRSSHSTAANQLDEVYVYKLTNAWVWTTTQRDIAAKAIAWTWIWLTFNSSGMTISADTSVLATKADIADFGWFEVVATLPSTGETNIIYLLWPIGTWADKYEEWIYTNSTWTKIWETSIDLSDLNTKTFYISSTSDLTNAQAALDWYLAGKNPIIVYDWKVYVKSSYSTSLLWFTCTYPDTENLSSYSFWKAQSLNLNISSWTVTSISTLSYRQSSPKVLATDYNYSTPYTPQYNWSPTTKKYVDDRDIYIGSSAPTSNLVEWRVRYDTTNDQLKVYDGSQRNATWKEYTAGEWIEIINGDDYSAMRWPCPKWFHIPWYWDWLNIVSYWEALGAWTSNSSSRDNIRTYLKIPAPWYRYYPDWSVYAAWSHWEYRCNNALSNTLARTVDFTNSRPIYGGSAEIANWCFIRAIKDVPVAPDSNWTEIFRMSWTPQGMYVWIYHNPSLWIISISNNTGWSWITIADKNVGATTVWNRWDTESSSNAWWFFQRWNNYMFPISWNLPNTSSTQVNASNYWPWNYYSSDTFIIWSQNWSSVQNDDLRWATTWVVTLNNAITNTWVLSVNGQTGDVTIPTPEESNTKTFYASVPSQWDTTLWQQVYDWIKSGNYAILQYWIQNVVIFTPTNTTTWSIYSQWYYTVRDNGDELESVATLYWITVSSWTVTSVDVSPSISSAWHFFEPGWTATTGYVVTKTANGYGWQAPTWWIQLAPNSTYNVKYHRYWPETDYANLSQYYTDNPKDTAYFTTDE